MPGQFLTLPIDRGMDLVTCPQAIQPGALADCLNYEVARQRGIRRIDGYELYDGGYSPSSNQLVNVQAGLVTGNITANFVAGRVVELTTNSGINCYMIVVSSSNTYNGGTNRTTLNFTGYITTQPVIVFGSPPAVTGSVLPSYGSISRIIDTLASIFITNGVGTVTFINTSNGISQGTVASLLTALATSYTTTSSHIQPVPGQGNVNGVFWLKDKLYATRDYFAANFNTGTIQPNPGDVIYVGASLGAATWSGTVAKLNVTGGSWTGLSAGNAVGVLMVYNTSGTLNNADTLNNNTQTISGFATAGTSGAGNATSTAAGLYVATGGRGATVATQSWQWCDLGWTIQYNTGGTLDFVDMNVALTLSQTPQYVTTAWKTGTTGNQAGWNLVGGTWPAVVAAQGDSEIAFHSYFTGGNSKPVSGTFTSSGFGFTNADIPPNASIAGIEIQLWSGSLLITSTGTTAAAIDKTIQLGPVASGPTPNLASSTTYTPATNITDAGNVPSRYTFALRDIGAPTSVPSTPSSLLGYTGITQPDIINANFALSYAVALSGTQTSQHLYYAVDQVRMRFSYLPQTNGIYFWNGTTAVRAQVVQHYKQGGVLASSNATGTLYIQFVNAAGVAGGVPTRIPGAGEQIRTYPTSGAAPDGGVADGSTQIANSASTADMNAMDWSALLTGAPQPDGSLAPASKYQSVTQNFFASSGLEAIYGVSGGGPAFYYDGIKVDSNNNLIAGNFSRILTGLPLKFETPRAVTAHQGHIILGYYAGVIQWSNGANVLSYDPTLYDQTAGQNGFGKRVTGLASINGDTLAVGTQSTNYMMQGNFNSPTTLYASIISPTSGLIEYTLQPMANYVYCDFRGLTMLGTTQKYGDFEIGHISSAVSPFITPRVQLSAFFESANTGIINSVLCRNKNQYRAQFADGYQLTLTFLVDGEPPQFTIQQYTNASGAAMTWDVIQAFTESLGRDRIFGATADGTGNVFEIDRGNSFNGAVINAYAILVPDTTQAAFQNKVFSGINVFGQAQDFATFNLSRSANYAIPGQGTGGNAIVETFGASTAVPTGKIRPFVTYGTSALQLEGTAINLRFDSSSSTQFPHVIQAVSYTVKPAQQQAQ